jgi:lipopolysaccharide biosynthesis protein
MNEKLKIIAFYLPQFHTIPENDKWWGAGFTEWTNVKKAKPLFGGHYQPHVPEDSMGYYDLRDSEIREKQAKIAAEHGIYGFCYYHYWFGGKKLLEAPFQDILKNKKPNFPFCICWANENWTRTWDGYDNEVLISQKHSDQDDLFFIRDLIPALKDDRYIKINGKPLLIIYRTELFPNILRSAGIWRQAARDAGIGEIYLTRVESFESGINPENIGFDAAIEFTPDWKNLGKRISLSELPDAYKENNKLEPVIYDYENVTQAILLKKTPNYKLFRGAFPSWDNTPRKGAKGTVMINTSPENFEYFLERQANNTYKNLKGEERLVFLNAWNEWGEGCHLEPDKKYGNKYLDVCKKISTFSEESFQVKNVYQKRIENLESYINENFPNMNRLDLALDEIKLIKSSKFWKLRDLYIKYKRLISGK